MNPSAAALVYDAQMNADTSTDVVERGRVGAGRGQGDLHLQGGDQRVMGGASSSLGLPPVLAQTASQQEVLPRRFILARKAQQGVLCRDTTTHT